MEETEKIMTDEYFDCDDVTRLIELSKKAVSHNIDYVYVQATILAILMNSKKTKKMQREMFEDVFDEKFDNENFRWAMDSKMIDWGKYVILPSWIKTKIRPFPMAWWQLSVSATLIAILYVVVMNYIGLA